MRSTCRSFMAVILFAMVAAAVSAQESTTPVPQAVPDPVTTPVADLAPMPAADPVVPAAVPAVTEPVAPAVEPSAAALQAAPVQVTATAKRVAKKVAPKPAGNPALQESEAFKAAAAAASVPAVDTTTNTLPPPDAAAAVAPAAVVAPPPAAPKASVVETGDPAEPDRKKLGVGSWVLFGIALAAFAAIAVKFLRRRKAPPTSMMGFNSNSSPELKPAPVPRV
jgi:hypothetical protein